MKKTYFACLIQAFVAESPTGPEELGTGTPFIHRGISVSEDQMSMARLERLSDGKTFLVPHRLTSVYPRFVSITKGHGLYQLHHPFFVVFDGIAPSRGNIRVSECPDCTNVVEIPDSIVEAISRHPLEEQVAV